MMNENERKDGLETNEIPEKDNQLEKLDLATDADKIEPAEPAEEINIVEQGDAVDQVNTVEHSEVVLEQPEHSEFKEPLNRDFKAESIPIHDETKEAKPVHVRKGKKVRLTSVLMVVLSLVLISGSTYTIGYYHGQINLNEAAISDKVDKLLESNYKAEIYKSVKDYIDESGINSNISDSDVTEIYKNVGNSIVGITSKSYIYDWFNNQQEATAKGSGVIIDQNSELYYIVTNYHVISDATDVVVELAKDQIVNSTLVGYDESTDLAVITVKKSDINADLQNQIKPIAVGESSKLQIGEVAIAIGNPLGYSNTVTQGIISAVDRQVADDESMTYIQTDAAINPGNSGGALVNNKGELIGINSAKIAETDVEGMGFAIPSEKMMAIVKELMEKGYVSRPYIGIGGVDVDENSAKLYNIPMGVLVKYVYDASPAQKAGIQVMDLIVGVNDDNVYNMEDLTTLLAKYKPGDTVKVKLVRNEKENMVIDVVLGERGTQKK